MVDLSLKNRNETVADLISQLLDKVITAKPELLDGDSLVADEINDSVGTSQDSGEKEEKTEYTNKTFADLKERFKPIYNFFTQNSNPIVISLIGGAFHLLDGFAETMENQTAKNIQGLTRGVSVFYSRAITGLPVVVEAIDSLAKNNVTEAITRLWVLARATCSEPANMNFAPGLFMGYQFFSDLAGADKKTFNSVAENFSYIGNKAKEFYSENFKQLLGEGTLLEKFKNLSRLIVPSTMFASGIGGPIFVGNEVTSPKAKFWSNLRNAPGLLGDFLLFDMGINKVKEKHGENISKPKLIQELMKTKNGILGTAFAGLSVGATAQRYFDKYINISSQFICGLSETFTSLWSMLGKLEEKQAQAA